MTETSDDAQATPPRRPPAAPTRWATVTPLGARRPGTRPGAEAQRHAVDGCLDRAAKLERWTRKLRRAVFANLSGEALATLQVHSFKEGQKVVWLQTRGAGGSFKPNEKEGVFAEIVADDGGRYVRVRVTDDLWLRDKRPVSVMRRNVLPVAVAKLLKVPMFLRARA